ncbi:MAG TPA: aldo/keto reductase [Flavipsychrobacter sp.]|nr:aldo/keto reductase [Flavipsychrobacter sp.]
MEKRKIGSTGIEIAPLVLGGNVFGWTVDEQNAFKIFDAFVDAGLNCIDTADGYSKWARGNKGGESETIIGNWLKKSGKRDKVIIATKVGTEMAPNKKGLSKKYILQEIEDSLKRLQTDHIDLYQSHFDDLNTPVQETLEAYAQLIKEGKVVGIGASNLSPERLVESLKTSKELNIPSYQCLQPQYNLYDREKFEKEYEQICKEWNLGVICYYSLAAGFLTGKYRSEADMNKSPRGQGVKKYMNTRGFNILRALDEVAKEYNSTLASVSLAWIIAQPHITAPIASATSVDQLQDLVKATQLKLDKTAINKLTQASTY